MKERQKFGFEHIFSLDAIQVDILDGDWTHE